MTTQFSVEHGDVTEVPADLLLLKYAGTFYGADRNVADVLTAAKVCTHDDLWARPGDFRIVETEGAIVPSRVMFLGTPSLAAFDYGEMYRFAARSVEILAQEGLSVKRMATTIHGVGYGLDALESLQSLIRGFCEGMVRERSVSLEEIAFVERNQRTARILSSSLAPSTPTLPPSVPTTSGIKKSTPQPDPPNLTLAPPTPPPQPPDEPTAAKRHIFVAMPYADEFEDVYEFGIYGPVRNCGFICERVDQAAFTGDILERIRQRIETADLVIADLTGGRPNVYLEVGYAWGHEVPVVFIAREGEEPHFDVRTHRCIYYKTIGQLAKDLEKLIQGLRQPE